MPTGGDHTKYVPKLREKPLPGGDDMTPGAWADLCNGLMAENQQLKLQIGELQESLTEERRRYGELFDQCDKQGAELGAICDERQEKITTLERLIDAMRPVVDGAILWKKNEKWPYLVQGGWFAHAIDAYEKTLTEKRVVPVTISIGCSCGPNGKCQFHLGSVTTEPTHAAKHCDSVYCINGDKCQCECSGCLSVRD